MKKIKYGLLLVGLLTITGCAAVNETFDVNQFHTQEFKENYYHFIPEKYLNDEQYTETIYDLTDKVILSTPYESAYNNIILSDITSQNITLQQAVELYGDENVKKIKVEDYAGNEAGYVLAVNEALADPMNIEASWFNYARHNSLTAKYLGESVSKSFKQGIFSKLTDTLIVCNGSGPLVRIQIDEKGMGQIFDHELIDYQNFIISARGGTNVNYSELGIPFVRYAKVKMNISFFIEKSTTSPALKHTISYVVPEMNVDNNSITTVMKMDLSALLPASALKRVSGMTISYELLEHDYLMPGGVKDSSLDYEFSMMLYEVMFPYSSWR